MSTPQDGVKFEEILNEKLMRKFQGRMSADSIAHKANDAIKERAKTFEMAGFRKGRVPETIVRKHIGQQVIQETIEREIDALIKGFLEKNNIKLAGRPSVEINDFDDKKELVFTVSIEVLPEVPSVSLDNLAIMLYNVLPSDDDLKNAHKEIVKNFNTFSNAGDAPAKKGDAVMINFVGYVDGEPFDGGKGEDVRLELGSGAFIPGFEEKLIGAKVGAHVKVEVTFPKQYHDKKVAGKLAVFEVDVKEVLNPEKVAEINDEFAQKLGLKSVEELNDMLLGKLEADFGALARLLAKRKLFEDLDKEYSMEVPESMLKLDFDTMWSEVKRQLQSNPEMFGNKNESEVKKEYEQIAKRRVKTGIILMELARANDIEIDDKDYQQAIIAEAMQKPGQEKLVMEFYQDKRNLDKLTGPLLEEKVIDFILKKAKVTTEQISSAEFFEKYAAELNAMNPMGGDAGNMQA